MTADIQVDGDIEVYMCEQHDEVQYSAAMYRWLTEKMEAIKKKYPQEPLQTSMYDEPRGWDLLP